MSEVTTRPMRRKRRWRTSCFAVVLLLVIGLVVLPWWLPWILRPVLAHYGVQMGEYERLGYGRLALNEIHYSRRGLEVRIGRLETLTPYGWIWNRWQDRPVLESDMVQASLRDWRVTLTPHSSEPAEPGTKHRLDSMAQFLDGLERVLPAVNDWVDSVEAAHGEVLLANQRHEVSLVRWHQGQLHVAAGLVLQDFEQEAALHVALGRHSPYQLALALLPAGVQITSVVERVHGTWTATGNVHGLGGRVVFTNLFSAETWWPDEAQITAAKVPVPQTLLRLDGYRDLHSTWQISWKKRAYDLRGQFEAVPETNHSNPWPPLSLAIQVEGDLQEANLRGFRLESPWGDFRLVENASLQYQPGWLLEPAELAGQFDWQSFPWLQGEGILQGKVRIAPSPDSLPTFDIELASQSFRLLGKPWKELKARGGLNWPNFRWSSWEWTAENGGKLEASAEVDLEGRRVRKGTWSMQGGWLETWLPPHLTFTSLALNGAFSGSWTNLAHEGTITAKGVQWPGWRLMDVEAQWAGRMLDLTNFTAFADSKQAQLTAAGAFSVSSLAEELGTALDVKWRRLDWHRGDQLLYELAEPSLWRVSHAPPADLKSAPWSLAVEGFAWRGPERQVRLNGAWNWPDSGHAALTWQGLRLDDVRDWIEVPDGEYVLQSGHAEVSWDQGPLNYELAGEAEVQLPGDHRLRINADLAGDGTGLRLGLFELFDGEQRVALAGGRVPVQLDPAQFPLLIQPLQDDPIEISVALGQAEDYWAHWFARLDMRVARPSLTLALSGSLAHPVGRLTGQASRIEYLTGQTNWPLPAVEDLVFEVGIAEDALRVETCEWFVQGQKAVASGWVPLGATYWASLLQERRWPDWQQASLDMAVARAEVAALGKAYADVISPEGTVSGNLSLRPGGEWRGALILTNVSTRPFPPFGPLRDVQGLVSVSNRTLRVERLSGHLGGEPLNVNGYYSLSSPSAPEFDFRLSGTNVPLARQPGLILRSDLQLRFLPSTNGVPVLQGDVHLRDSLVLQNLSELLPGNLTKPTQRPPYFSLDMPLLRDWMLDLKVRGDRFLQMRNPLFRGELSATLDLKGTLSEPIAYGVVRVDEGRVQFPFATLNVDQGLATLTSQNPFLPELMLSAAGQNYGYRIRMDVEGDVNDPRIFFSSTPPLRSEEIVLMMTAGEIPQSTYRHTGTQKTSRAAMFLGRDLINRMSQDRVSAERLTVRSGEHVSSKGELTYYIEYRLNDRWSLVGEYDRFNAINAGLKWRLYSK